MSRFPDDYHVEALQGMRRPTRTEILRAIADRCAWLQHRISQVVAVKRTHAITDGPEMRELRALVCCAEIVEAFVDVGEDVADALKDAYDESLDEPEAKVG